MCIDGNVINKQFILCCICMQRMNSPITHICATKLTKMSLISIMKTLLNIVAKSEREREPEKKKRKPAHMKWIDDHLLIRLVAQYLDLSTLDAMLYIRALPTTCKTLRRKTERKAYKTKTEKMCVVKFSFYAQTDIRVNYSKEREQSNTI